MSTWWRGALPGFATPWRGRRGRIRTAGLVLPDHGCAAVPDTGFQATPRTEMKSAQRESNPHFRHGKAAGNRYIMGASNRWSNCQRSQSGWWLVTSGRKTKIFVLTTSQSHFSLLFQWDQRGSNPHRPG